MRFDKRDKAIKLIALYRSDPDSPQGQTARRLADKILDELGLTEEDLIHAWHCIVQPCPRDLWERAVAELALGLAGLEFRWTDPSTSRREHGLFARVLPKQAGDLATMYNTCRREILSSSKGFSRQMKMTVDVGGLDGAIASFRNYVVLGVAQDLVVDIDAGADMPNLDALLDDPGPARIDYDTAPPSGYRGGQRRMTRTVHLEPGPEGLKVAPGVARSFRRIVQPHRAIVRP